MTDLELAILVATTAHAGQQYSDKEPHIMHPLRVMMYFSEEEEQVVAVLHDVIEDTHFTESDLRRGFSDAVVDALVILTHTSGVSYENYIKRLSRDPLARRIKLADICENLRYLDQIDNVARRNRLRKKYTAALEILFTEF